jgi:anti-anti-sigma factor
MSVAEGIAFIDVTGELDLSNADELSTAALGAMTPVVGTIRIDFGGVTFMDSTGLNALIRIRNAAGEHYSVVVENPQPNVRRIFELTDLDEVFLKDHAVAGE